MKLRNKKTSGVFDVAFHSSYKDGKITIGVEVDADPKYPKCNFSDYESLEEFCENWEDYEPVEPLIKDEKIRKAVRAWAEVNGIDDVEYDAAWNAFRRFNFTICFDYFFDEHDSLEDGEKYTITELCGEEEE